MDFSKIKFGMIPSKHDSRNYTASNIVAPINVFPDEFCLDVGNLEITDQGFRGDCGAESMAYINYILKYRRDKNIEPFSVGWIYGNRDKEDGTQPGMQPLMVLKHQVKEGNVPRSVFPTVGEAPDIINEVNKVKSSLLPLANKYKLGAFAELVIGDDILNVLYQLKTPIYLGIPIFKSFYFTGKDGKVPMPDLTDMSQFVGLHLVALIGWNKDNEWIIPNSWGKDKGKDGYFFLPSGYPFAEVWGVTDDTNNLNLPTPIPNPTPTPVPTVKHPVLKIGSTGEEVKKLQEALNNLTPKQVIVDGIFGKETDIAVRTLQLSKGLEIDGIVGAKTWEIVDEVLQELESKKVKWWRVQASANRNIEYAKADQEKLKKLGYNTYLVNVDGWYKVQLNAFKSEQNCRNFSQELKDKGIDNFVVFY